jgi:hypothetical protein
MVIIGIVTNPTIMSIFILLFMILFSMMCIKYIMVRNKKMISVMQEIGWITYVFIELNEGIMFCGIFIPIITCVNIEILKQPIKRNK